MSAVCFGSSFGGSSFSPFFPLACLKHPRLSPQIGALGWGWKVTNKVSPRRVRNVFFSPQVGRFPAADFLSKTFFFSSNSSTNFSTLVLVSALFPGTNWSLRVVHQKNSLKPAPHLCRAPRFFRKPFLPVPRSKIFNSFEGLCIYFSGRDSPPPKPAWGVVGCGGVLGGGGWGGGGGSQPFSLLVAFSFFSRR